MTAPCIPPYRVSGVLGQGAAGVVHKAFDPRIGRTAIKTIHSTPTETVARVGESP